MGRPKGSRNRPKSVADIVTTYPEGGDKAVEAYHDMIERQTLETEILRNAGVTQRTNGPLPRSEKCCKNCDFSRLVFGELRCWESPPEPYVAGALPPVAEGAMPRPVVIPLQRPTFPDYCCPRWATMAADHPDFGVTTTVADEPVPAGITH